jgi:hypothetical protein
MSSYTFNGQYGSIKGGISAITVYQIHGRLQKLSQTCHAFELKSARSRPIWGGLKCENSPNMSSYTFNGQYGSIKEWSWGVSAITVYQIHGRLQKLSHNSHAFELKSTRSRPIWGGSSCENSPNMSSYTFNGQYGSIKERSWGVSLTTQKLCQPLHAVTTPILGRLTWFWCLYTA